MNLTRCLFAATLCLAVFPGAAQADEAEDAFQKLFGAEYKKAAASPSTADDAALAAKMLEEAQGQGVSLPLLNLLCEKAYELGVRHSQGHKAAIGAMELAAEKAPAKKTECLEKITALLQKDYLAARKPEERAAAGSLYVDALLATTEAHIQAEATAEAAELAKKAHAAAKVIGLDKSEVQCRLDGFAERQRLAKRVAGLKATVGVDSKDAKSRNELVRLLLVEMDDPAQALIFLDDSCDEALRKYVPASVKPAQRVPVLARKELGDWYRSLADGAGASTLGKAAMLRRARICYGSFLAAWGSEDMATRTQVAMALRKVEEGLCAATAATAVRTLRPDKWIDLVELVDPPKDAVNGSWQCQDGSLMCTKYGWSRLAFPLALEGSYEIAMTLVRPEGGEFVMVFLPAGANTTVLHISRVDGSCNLADVRGRSVGGLNIKLVGDKEYALTVKVLVNEDQAEIAADLDGKTLIRWQGPQSALSVPGDAILAAPKCPGLGGHVAPIVFKNVKLRMLTGKARVLR